MANTLPFFKNYPADWLLSEKMAGMMLHEVGAYKLLIDHQWLAEKCTLPDDVVRLKNLVKWKDDEHGDFSRVLACFPLLRSPRGRRGNPRLLAVYAEAMSRQETAIMNGVKGAALRWQKVKETRAARKERTPHANGKTTFPIDWKLTPEEAAQWSKHGLNPHIEFASFKDHALANDRRCKDWQAAYRNWCRKSITKLESAR